MAKKALAAFAVCLFGTLAAAPLHSEPSVSESARVKTIDLRTSKVAENVIWEAKLRCQVEFLSDSVCSGRGTGSLGSVEAGMWIARQWKNIGVRKFGESYFSTFRTSTGKTGRDIIGMLPGYYNASSSMYVIVMAHYDGLGTIAGTMYPGADSNGSGVAALNSVAEMFKTMTKYHKRYSRNIIFAALDAKEPAMDGSAHLWELISGGKLKDPMSGKVIGPENIALVVNLDQVGGTMSTLRSGRKDFLLLLSGVPANEYYMQTLRKNNERYGIGLELSGEYFGSEPFTRLFYEKVSDQRIFLQNGIRSVMFTSGITMNNNKPQDTADSIDYTILKKRIWLIFHWIEAMM